ncbi:Transcriptional regulatory protein sin3 [Savitreella phatthalungensis]
MAEDRPPASTPSASQQHAATPHHQSQTNVGSGPQSSTKLPGTSTFSTAPSASTTSQSQPQPQPAVKQDPAAESTQKPAETLTGPISATTLPDRPPMGEFGPSSSLPPPGRQELPPASNLYNAPSAANSNPSNLPASNFGTPSGLASGQVPGTQSASVAQNKPGQSDAVPRPASQGRPPVSHLGNNMPPATGAPDGRRRDIPSRPPSVTDHHNINPHPAYMAGPPPLPASGQLPSHDSAQQMGQQAVVQAAQRAADAGYRPLNVKDALSYLDQVKIQFYDQPDVYNRFLDIMKDFKSQSIDTPGVIERVSTLFRGHPTLVQGFNTFLPPGYRIECSMDPSDPNPIRVTTPQGTVSQVNGQNGGPTRFSAPVPNMPAGGWRTTDDQYAANNAAYGMTMVSQAASQQQNGMPGGVPVEKKPVEFNHAINYVNKIKQRFSGEPDTYKHFLEILQTYQKDAKPIQEVYSQVTELFKGAQDLLQDFKQFLPENNASASAAARMPTVGTFAPPQQAPPAPAPRDKKRRPAEPASRQTATKKAKSAHRTSDIGPVSPNLLPAAPEALPPPTGRYSTHIEELAFFDRAKRFINNKQAAVEFFKVLNLFTQEIIDKNTLVEKIDNFLGGSPELMDQFKKIVNYTGADEYFDNLPYNSRPKVDLSLCKAFGPSYRQLPKSETLLPCSGRDDMCWEVLNDVYVSHPTWASEDAGFVAHRKSQYEEALHKIEEERYEYDLNIEANARTIQLLEPIAQRISNMVDDEKRHFKLPPGLGGQSIAIYQKVIKKIYDKERGQEVIDQLHENPVIAVPVVLKRLKQKDEEWKRAQREWNKVWRETEVKNYYKALDHQGIHFKTSDKKAMMVRNLVSEIETLRRVQLEKRTSTLIPRPEYQYHYSFGEHDIILDVQRLLSAQIERMSVSASEKEKMLQWNATFFPLFFGINVETIIDSAGGTADDIAAHKAFHSGVSTRRKKAGEEVDLLKSIMKRTREAAHSKHRKLKDSVAEADELETNPPSRSSTPAVTSLEDKAGDVEPAAIEEHAQEVAAVEESTDQTQEEAKATADQNVESWTTVKPNTPAPGEDAARRTYNMYCSSTFYCFFRWFRMLYERLSYLKSVEQEATRELKQRKPNQNAVELGLIAQRLQQLNIEIDDESDHYEQLLMLCENLIDQSIDQAGFEDMLRYIYGTKAYKIYTVDKVVGLMAKQLHAIVSDDKNVAQTQAFQKDRTKAQTTAREQIVYRIQMESAIGTDDTIYRLEWDNSARMLHIQLMGKDDVPAVDAQSQTDAWRYYLDSFAITKPTFGVPQDKVRPCLQRNLPRAGDDEEEQEVLDRFVAHRYIQSRLELKICRNTYKIFYVGKTEDLIRKLPKYDGFTLDKEDDFRSARSGKFEDWISEKTSSAPAGKHPFADSPSESAATSNNKQFEQSAQETDGDAMVEDTSDPAATAPAPQSDSAAAADAPASNAGDVDMKDA